MGFIWVLEFMIHINLYTAYFLFYEFRKWVASQFYYVWSWKLGHSHHKHQESPIIDLQRPEVILHPGRYNGQWKVSFCVATTAPEALLLSPSISWTVDCSPFPCLARPHSSWTTSMTVLRFRTGERKGVKGGSCLASLLPPDFSPPSYPPS